VEILDTYKIPFRGLKTGTHRFDLEAGAKFFEMNKSDQILTGKVRVQVDLEKQERMLVLWFTLEGSVSTLCDRCNEPLEIPVSGKERLILKFGETYEEQSDEVQIIPETATRFDAGPFIFEYIHLLMPLKRVHPDDDRGNSTCDPQALKKLEELSHPPPGDARWEALEKLRGEDPAK
jgi:uncharacterized protein